MGNICTNEELQDDDQLNNYLNYNDYQVNNKQILTEQQILNFHLKLEKIELSFEEDQEVSLDDLVIEVEEEKLIS